MNNKTNSFITLYSTGCPKCSVLIKKLDMANVDYVICEDTDIMLAKGFTTIPVLEVNDRIMEFKEAVDWLKERAK